MDRGAPRALLFSEFSTPSHMLVERVRSLGAAAASSRPPNGSLVPASLPPPVCRHCQRPLQRDARFCSSCGGATTPRVAPRPMSVVQQGGTPFWKIVLGIVFLLWFIGYCAHYALGPSRPNDVTRTSSQSRSAATAIAPVVVLRVSGTTNQVTEKFQATNDWDLVWNYKCSSAYKENFIVRVEDRGDAGYRNSSVNDLDFANSGTNHYHQSGTYYLDITAHCPFNIKVINYS